MYLLLILEISKSLQLNTNRRQLELWIFQIKGDDWSCQFNQYQVTLLDNTKHGEVRLIDHNIWTYSPMTGYTGADRAIYLIQNKGKQYKVVVNFWVLETIDENRDVQECESIDFGTSNGSSTTVPGLTPVSEKSQGQF